VSVKRLILMLVKVFIFFSVVFYQVVRWIARTCRQSVAMSSL